MYTVLTVPFAHAKVRALHFRKHGHEFGAADEFEYERMADAFMDAPLRPGLHEGFRTVGTFDRIRLDELTRHFGVAYNKTILRTYYVRNEFSIAHWGGPAGVIAHECAEVK